MGERIPGEGSVRKVDSGKTMYLGKKGWIEGVNEYVPAISRIHRIAVKDRRSDDIQVLRVEKGRPELRINGDQGQHYGLWIGSCKDMTLKQDPWTGGAQRQQITGNKTGMSSER